MKKVDLQLTDEQQILKEKLEYGDITNLASALDISRMTIWNTLNGKRQSPYIWDAIKQLVSERDSKRNEKITLLNQKNK